MKKKAFLFDRDGTLIRDKNYICEYSEVEVFPFSIEALKIAESKNFILIGITNQSSIARGICTKDQVEEIHDQLIKHFNSNGVNISKIYYCPFHEDAVINEYKRNDICRKPEPGMILNAGEEFDIDLSNSYVIGDSTRDIIAGIKAGCKTALVLTGNGKKARIELEELKIEPDIVAENLLEISKLI